VSEGKLPLTLLAGFLGSGKTTLVNRILSERHGERIAVVVNEFGDAGIDGRLVVGAADEVVELANGCVCCTVRGDLARTLSELLAKRRRRLLGGVRFDRVLVEASGLASPGPIAQTLEIVPELGEAIALDGIVTLARADAVVRQLEEHPEAAEQVGYADRIVLNACDLASGAEIDAAEAALRARNAVAPIERAVRADVPLASVLGVATGDPRAWDLLATETAAGTPRTHVHGGVGTVTLRSDAALDVHRLKMWLQFLATRKTHEVLRLKGILRCGGLDHAVVVQGVHQWLELGPTEGPPPAESVLVLIGRDLDRAELERGWRAAH
jgi:G3E family GTPase